MKTTMQQKYQRGYGEGGPAHSDVEESAIETSVDERHQTEHIGTCMCSAEANSETEGQGKTASRANDGVIGHGVGNSEIEKCSGKSKTKSQKQEKSISGMCMAANGNAVGDSESETESCESNSKSQTELEVNEIESSDMSANANESVLKTSENEEGNCKLSSALKAQVLAEKWIRSGESSIEIDKGTNSTLDKQAMSTAAESSRAKTGDDVASVEAGIELQTATEQMESSGELGTDTRDGLGKLFSCVRNRFKPLDEDKLPYGVYSEKEFDEIYGFKRTRPKTTEPNVTNQTSHVQREDFDEGNQRPDTKPGHGTVLKEPGIIPSTAPSISGQNVATNLATSHVHNSNGQSLNVAERCTENHVKNRTMIYADKNQTTSIQHYQKRVQSGKGNKSRANTPVEETEYKFTHPERGYMVLVVNEFKGKNFREGADIDVYKSKEIAKKLGFQLYNQTNHWNLSRQQTLELLQEVKKMDHSDCDSFLFIFSSHGLELHNARANGKLDHALVCADERFIFISDIIEMFNDRNCPSLKDKPKLFIIQACRGEDVDDGGTVFVAHPRLPEDRHCGVVNADMAGSNSRGTTLDMSDTKPGDDSWATNRLQMRDNVPSSRMMPIRESAPTHSRLGRGILLESGTGRTEGRMDLQPEGGHLNVCGNPRGCPSDLEYGTHACVDPRLSAPAVQTQHSQHYAPGHLAEWGRVLQAPSHVISQLYTPRKDTPSLKCDSDMLIMYAIPSGMFAWRNSTIGSWMIHYLHHVIVTHDLQKPMPLLSLLTKVVGQMSRRSTYTPSNPESDGKMAIPVIEHRLQKDVVFQQTSGECA